jgi:hypothetical protein
MDSEETHVYLTMSDSANNIQDEMSSNPRSSFSSSQEHPTLRRSSIASTGTVSSVSSVIGNGRMTEDDQEERRRNIKAIMSNSSLSQKEKSLKIQSLMDGRGQVNQLQLSQHGGSYVQNRRGSASSYCSNASSVYASSMAQVAAEAVETIYNADYDESLHTTRSYSYSSSQTDDVVPDQQQQQNINNLGCYKQYHGRSKSLQDWTDSDRANAAAHTTVFGNKIQQVSRLMEQSRPACEHYERNCTVISPCCGLAFGCRICHDECPVLPPPIVYKRRLSANAADTKAKTKYCTPIAATVRNNDVSSTTALADTSSTTQIHHLNKLERRRSLPVEFSTDRTKEADHHLIDRFAIREVICRHCYTRQSSKTYVIDRSFCCILLV